MLSGVLSGAAVGKRNERLGIGEGSQTSCLMVNSAFSSSSSFASVFFNLASCFSNSLWYEPSSFTRRWTEDVAIVSGEGGGILGGCTVSFVSAFS